MGEKIKSLFQLKEFGLPVPDFQIFKDKKEIKWIGTDKEYCGWCLRSSLEEGRDIMLPFAAYVSKEEVLKKVEEFQKKLGEKATFILYPAWKFTKSGNLMILDDEIILEAVRGFVRSLSSGERLDIHYSFRNRGLALPILKKVHGDESLLSDNEIKQIIYYVNKIPIKNVVLEWSFNDKGEFYFHDIIKIKN